jgi:tight adherence protein C
MAFAVFTFVVMFLLIASGGLLLFYREAMLRRVTEVVNPQERQGAQRGALHLKSSISGMVENLERLLPKSQAEVSVVQQRLISAGYRTDSAVKLFYGSKVLVPLTLCVLLVLVHNHAFIAYVLALGLGFLAPDFWLGRLIKIRQHKIGLSLPDVLDLLVICIEAGLSMDQATARTAEELQLAHPAICDELSIVVLEQRAGRPRSDAWRQFAERTGVDGVRNLVSVLVQSEQLGTSVAKTLRVHSDTLRTHRRQKVEEQAAKTTVKLVFPLVFFIFPSLFLVTLGPAIIIISESFTKYFNH